MIRWLKIKVTSEGKVLLAYEKLSVTERWDEYSVTSSEAPRPEFSEAMQALRHDVVHLCELSQDDADSLIVKGASFSYAGEKDIQGASISAVKRLKKSHSPLVLNTPYKAFASYSGGEEDPKAVHDMDCIDALKRLQDEAERFLNGERQQQDLLAQPEADTTPAAA